jgi:SAM-dependent methyltransferase
MSAQAGRYPIHRREGEIDRLLIQAQAMAPDAAIMLDRIGVKAGWRCLDLGCGPGGITDLLAQRRASVVGLDRDPVFLEYARRRAPGVEFVEGNAYATGQPRASFDLVHARFLASTAGNADALIREAIGLTRPGGTVAFEEPDITTLRCFPPLAAWDRLRDALAAVFTAIGGDVRLAQRLYPMMRHAGLADVQYRPFFVGVKSGDPMTDYLPATVESIRTSLLEARLMTAPELDEALRACRAHLADPDTVFTTYTVAQVWGTK